MTELVRMATLAANGHNTQPWMFRLSAGRMTILADFARRTAVVDPADHHLFVSLGCAAENLALAAGAQGRLNEIAFPAAPRRVSTSIWSGPGNRDALYRAIPLRQSTRANFEAGRFRRAVLLSAAAEEEGVDVVMFTEASDREAILELVVEGNSAQMNDPAFVAELPD